MSAPMPGIGHNSGDDAQARKEFVAAQIVLWVGNLRLDQALKAAELGQVSGLQKALLLRNGHIVAAVRHCRLTPKADSRMSIYTLITYLADNNNGICHLSVTRMCKILKRSREAIVNGINGLEEDGQIGVNRSSGMPSCYWPLIPVALADLSANPVWFVDGLSDKPKARVFSTPEGGIAAAKGDQSTPLDQRPERSSPLDRSAGGNRSTPVDAVVNSSRRTGQVQPCSISLSNSASDLKGQAAPNGQAQMADAFGGEAAFAARNIKVEKGRIIITYWYAWKGGPPLRGEPGSPEFVASYNEAVARKVMPPVGVIFSILQGYQASQDFRDLAARTRKDYIAKIKLIEKAFGDFPLTALSDRRTRGVFLAWRDRLALSSRRQADYSWVVLARVLSWGLNRGLIPANPCEKGGRLYGGSRADKVWSPADEANFLRKGPVHLHLPLLLALWTGQRQGDLLCLPWSGYDGSYIRLRQSKTGIRVAIPVGAPLKAALDAAARTKKSPLILVNSEGKPWTADGFRSSWRKACIAAGVVGVTFHDLRGTAVTRLALAGCTEAEIATITGHSLRDVRTILDSNYLHRDPALAESAIRKLEKRTKTPN